ncbi:MAG: c-type cytochrome [Gammaproteobacteria bacterium]
MKTSMNFLGAVLLGAAAVASAPASAAISVNQADSSKLLHYVDSEGLACMSCHSVGQKVVGPAWSAVAQKYHNDPHALALLTDRIENGGSGTWGSMPMPPGMANQQQAQKLAALIIGLDKK